MPYVPKPLDTSRVHLNQQLSDLIDRLAQNNHEVWARQRLADGWQYGPARDDQRKQHPSLIPYEELSDEEKAYDIVMATELVKAILALGFQVEKN
jgi:hypothetical protein